MGGGGQEAPVGRADSRSWAQQVTGNTGKCGAMAPAEYVPLLLWKLPAHDSHAMQDTLFTSALLCPSLA